MHRTRDWKKYLTVSSRNAIRAICETNNAPLGKKLRFAGAINRLADADEPEDFDDRNVLTQDGYATTEDLMWSANDDDGHQSGDEADPDVEGDEDGYDVDDEPRSSRWRFASLSFRDQDLMIARFKTHLCEKIGVSPRDWEPSNALILDAIEGDFSEEVLVQMAYAEYFATPQPPEDNPSDNKEPNQDEGADLIRISQYSGERGLPNIGYRFSNHGVWLAERDRQKGPRTMKTRRPKSHSTNNESHWPKYGLQDYRHQLSRRQGKMERQMATYVRIVSDWSHEEWTVSFPKIEEESPTYLSVSEQIFMSSREEHMGEWLCDLDMKKFEERDREYEAHLFDVYYGRNPKRVQGHSNRFDDFGWDFYDPYPDADYDDYYMYTQFDGEPDDWTEGDGEFLESPFPDSWFYSDLRDDIFTYDGNSDCDVGALHIGHSSSMRFTGRYRPTRRMRVSITRLSA